jgi:glycerophosphoryl diester phosphodiesterase
MPFSDYPRIIAHRCGGRLAAENSRAGLRLAAGLGCRGVEFDVMLSRDGIPVLMHDETVDRTTGASGEVASLSLSALRALDIGGEPIPTLAEVLDDCRHLALWANIEIKPARGREVETGRVIGRMLKESWNGHGVVSSFSPMALAAARQQAPGLPLALLADDLPEDWLGAARDSGAIGWHLAATVTGEAIARVRASGLVVACYTVDDPAMAEQLFAAGAIAVFSDRPDHWPAGEM